MAKRTGGEGWSLVSSDSPQNTARTAVQPPEKQRAVIALEKRKKGKVVTLVRNLALPDGDIRTLAKQLKTMCGTGGTSKNGEIELQGDCRDRVRAYLQKEGYGLK